ncbi:MAG TPA: DMT family transporter [Armatimonadota bacterium]|nr:DMT family transporter [Armatimonadota bacterium]
MLSHKKSVLFLLIAALLWSTSGVLLKTMPSVHWLAIAGLRSAFAAIIFLPGLAQRRPPLTRLLPAILIYVVVVGALMGAMQLGTAAQGIWLQYIAPAVVAVWAWLIQRQRIRRAELAAVLLTVIAVVLIVTGGNGLAHRQSVLLGLASGVAFGLFIIVLKTLGDTPPAGLFFWTNLSAAAIIIPAGLASGIAFPTASRELILLAAMGIFQLGLAYYFFQWGLAHARAVEASLIVLLEPILNPIWVYLVLGEMPGLRVALGCALIALALVAMAVLPNRRR